MEGVILFADDHIFEVGRIENALFQKFNNEGNFSILPINNLNNLEKTVTSISTYKALILDWNFERNIEGDEGYDDLVVPDETPLEFLKSNKVYSLVYVYSQANISQEIKDELQALYPGKIFFETKNAGNEANTEYEKIIAGISQFENNNKHLNVPFIWSQSINKSSQEIFSELEKADPNWLKEIYTTAQNDGTEPNTEVISVFHHLLNESIIQNKPLLNAIDANAAEEDIVVGDKEESLAKLYNRIYYTKLKDGAPLMTGDIFKFSEEEYAILFTPECDINTKKEKTLEFLVFQKNNYIEFLKSKREYERGNYEDIKSKGYKNDAQGNPTKELKGKLRELIKDFNNGDIKNHLLPSFPFDNGIYNLSALIDFETAFVVKAKADFEEKRSGYKLNSPYIYQLRQRYLAYIGRVGVPAIPQSLRLYNLK
ncbi:hypothetical protein [Elizabethkingia miricola]|uniref:hypothetical protein n=3 Tax=Elizabethkingia miricola TaxID=172045 RepID=UPI000C15A0AA|nr:hypothetical protein [Elizabethkingia miricola]NHQ72483.1 hypothetical protein [Elizabethkingia miricola]NHQ79206.1 hypothetical protein [Elizabethkingia miricola]PSL88991.1 hypothetical protein C7V10_06675 [Elizabethkingia miricola]QHQ85775.1 hypothetical protein FE632_02725 [Elizabethkingia miricola]UIO97006.1 hypothetical protein LYZ41_02725 [Elizabethkingia miricola]